MLGEAVGMGLAYKGVRFSVSPWRTHNGWRASVSLTYHERERSILRFFTIHQLFATPEEAEKIAGDFVKQWIDDGKPDLRSILSCFHVGTT
jgi:hypothetical protein